MDVLPISTEKENVYVHAPQTDGSVSVVTNRRRSSLLSEHRESRLKKSRKSRMSTLLTGGLYRHSTFQDIQAELMEIDEGGTGKFDINEIAEFVDLKLDSELQTKRMKYCVTFLASLILFILLGNGIIMWQVSNAFETMIPNNMDNVLANKKTGETIKVGQALQPLALDSRLSDETFLEMRYLEITSPSGGFLSLFIEGFARIPEDSSLYGSYIKLVTSSGVVRMEGHIMTFDRAETGLFKEAGFNISPTSMNQGRRLVGVHKLLGLFNSIPSFEGWNATNDNIPILPTHYHATFRIGHSCVAGGENDRCLGYDYGDGLPDSRIELVPAGAPHFKNFVFTEGEIFTDGNNTRESYGNILTLPGFHFHETKIGDTVYTAQTNDASDETIFCEQQEATPEVSSVSGVDPNLWLGKFKGAANVIVNGKSVKVNHFRAIHRDISGFRIDFYMKLGDSSASVEPVRVDLKLGDTPNDEVFEMIVYEFTSFDVKTEITNREIFWYGKYHENATLSFDQTPYCIPRYGVLPRQMKIAGYHPFPLQRVNSAPPSMASVRKSFSTGFSFEYFNGTQNKVPLSNFYGDGSPFADGVDYVPMPARQTGQKDFIRAYIQEVLFGEDYIYWNATHWNATQSEYDILADGEEYGEENDEEDEEEDEEQNEEQNDEENDDGVRRLYGDNVHAFTEKHGEVHEYLQQLAKSTKSENWIGHEKHNDRRVLNSVHLPNFPTYSLRAYKMNKFITESKSGSGTAKLMSERESYNHDIRSAISNQDKKQKNTKITAKIIQSNRQRRMNAEKTGHASGTLLEEIRVAKRQGNLRRSNYEIEEDSVQQVLKDEQEDAEISQNHINRAAWTDLEFLHTHIYSVDQYVYERLTKNMDNHKSFHTVINLDKEIHFAMRLGIQDTNRLCRMRAVSGQICLPTEVVATQKQWKNNGLDMKARRVLSISEKRRSLVALQGGNSKNPTNLKACIGECDKDSHCASGLKCFQRSGYTAIPGCSGRGKKSWDYCYDPDYEKNKKLHEMKQQTPNKVTGTMGAVLDAVNYLFNNNQFCQDPRVVTIPLGICELEYAPFLCYARASCTMFLVLPPVKVDVTGSLFWDFDLVKPWERFTAGGSINVEGGCKIKGVGFTIAMEIGGSITVQHPCDIMIQGYIELQLKAGPIKGTLGARVEYKPEPPDTPTCRSLNQDWLEKKKELTKEINDIMIANGLTQKGAEYAAYKARDVKLSGKNYKKPTNLKACIGECDKNSHCASGLKCFQRNGYTAIPGCSGRGKKNWDYCYNPNPIGRELWIKGNLRNTYTKKLNAQKEMFKESMVIIFYGRLYFVTFWKNYKLFGGDIARTGNLLA